MKKRLFSLALVAAMLLGMLVVPAGAAPAETASAPSKAYDADIWYEVSTPQQLQNYLTASPTVHYSSINCEENKNRTVGIRLTADLATKVDSATNYYAVLYVGYYNEDAEKCFPISLVLDLNGHTITDTSKNNRMIGVYSGSTLVITNGTILADGAYNGNGGVIFTNGACDVTMDGIRLVSTDTTDTSGGAAATTSNGRDGGLFYATANNSKLTIINSELEKQSGKVNEGGLISLSNKITGNISNSVLKGGTAIRGGSIYCSSSVTLTMTDTQVIGGRAISTTSSTLNRGGNIFCMGTATLTRCTITGGTAADDGGNMYFQSKTVKLNDCTVKYGFGGATGNNILAYGTPITINGGTILGGLNCTGTATFTGAPVISNYDCEGVQLGAAATFKNLTAGAKIVVAGEGALSKADVTDYMNAGYILPGTRTALTLEDGILTGAATDTGYCPHCAQTVTWTPYTPDITTSGHYYAEAATGVTPAAVPADADIVIDLRGLVELDAQVVNNGTLTFISSVDGGGILDRTAETVTDAGGLINTNGTLKIYGGTFNGSTTDNIGGTIAILSQSKATLYNGRITGGTSTSVNSDATYPGGNVHVAEKCTFTMEGGLVDGGTTTQGGGNIGLPKGTVVINDGAVLYGTANTSGGNLYGGSSSTLNINGGLVYGGKATAKGGNIYAASTNTKITVNGGTIAGGYAGDYGGNLYMNTGKFYFYDGLFQGGTAGLGAGNLYLNAGLYEISNNALALKYKNTLCVIGAQNIGDHPMVLDGRVLTTGTSGVIGYGGNVTLTGGLTLGKATISGGITPEGKARDLYVGKTSANYSPKLTVEPEFTDALRIRFATNYNTKTLTKFQVSTYGLAIHPFLTASAALNGKLTMENLPGEPVLFAGVDNALTPCTTTLVNESGDAQWYPDANAAAAAAQDGEYVKLYAEENTITATKDLTVDLNGKSLTATGRGTLSGFDSENDDYSGNGTAAVTGMTVADHFQAPNGYQYVTVAAGASYSFHRLGIGISGVSLRAASAGIYYQGTWTCDSTLQNRIASFGVAVSAQDMPKADFQTDPDTLYTSFDKTEFVSGQAHYSVLIRNIIKEGADNASRGLTKIYAAPYVLLDNGSVLVGQDSAPAEGGVAYDMKTVMQKVDPMLPGLTDAQKAGINKLFAKDPTTLTAWDLPNATALYNGTAPVRPLKVLTIGNSAANDDTTLLNLVAGAEGIGQEIIIGTLYYSGCKLTEHAKFLKNNSAVYTFYVSSSLTSQEAPIGYKNSTMLDGILYTDWDVIVMQGSSVTNYKETTYTDGSIQVIQAYVNEHKTNPNAIFAWNMFQANPEDNDLQTMYETQTGCAPENNGYRNVYKVMPDRQTHFATILNNVSTHIVTDSTFTYLIPTGTAVENALTSYLEEKDIHRDYTHLTDFSRVVAAYTWYCTLMGIDHLDEIKLNVIPANRLKSTPDKTQDRVLTEAEKALILEAVNNALANPLQVTQSQYTVAP